MVSRATNPKPVLDKRSRRRWRRSAPRRTRHLAGRRRVRLRRTRRLPEPLRRAVLDARARRADVADRGCAASPASATSPSGATGASCSWPPTPTPGFTDLRSGLERELAGVFGSSPSDMWAVGEAGTVVALRRARGRRRAGGTSANLRDVWGTGPTTCGPSGDGGTVLHYDGSAFAPVASGTTANLSAVFTARPDDVWIGGDGATLLHWDGTSMTPVTLAGRGPGDAVLRHARHRRRRHLAVGRGLRPDWGKATSPTSTARRGHRSEVLTFASYGGSASANWRASGQLAAGRRLGGGRPAGAARRRARRLHALRRHDVDPAAARPDDVPQPEPPFVFPNRDRPSFVFGPHDRWPPTSSASAANTN